MQTPRRSPLRAPVSLALAAAAALWGGCGAPPSALPDGGAPDLAHRVRKPLTKSIDDLIAYQELGPLVNPLVGTAGEGHVVPGALVPHGAVKLSPDSALGSGSIKTYDYNAPEMEGFSHFHLEGPGGSQYGYSEILVMPTRGPVVAKTTTVAGYASAFRHDTERAEAGYYAVDLSGPAARAELTATRLCGVHRYTFTGADPANLLFDVAHTRGQFLDGAVEIVGNQDLRGHGDYEMSALIEAVVDNFQRKTLPDATTGRRSIHFAAHLSRPFDHFGTWDDAGPAAAQRSGMNSAGLLGAWVGFDHVDTPVELQVCVSFIDDDQAAANLQAEIAGRSFDTVRAAASQSWNKILNRIQVQGGSDAQRALFYTTLYHAFFQPADVTEQGRYWSGEDGKGTVLPAPDWSYYTDDWCMWDTFRTTHPLQLLLEPERRSDIIQSIVNGYVRGGWLPKCSWQATGYSRVMTGNPFVPIIADAYDKGFNEFDVDAAWAGLMKSSTSDQAESLLQGLCGYFNQGTPPDFATLGYVPHECDHDQSASMTLEHSLDAWAMSRMAAALGKSAEQAKFAAQAGNYRNVVNPAHGFAQGRMRSGAWVEPFDPALGGSGNDFTEATSWIYTWLVPHDVRGLMGLLGGRQQFTDKLDQYFDGGHHDPTNEPGFHTPWLYDYAGAPGQTARRVRDILGASFAGTPDGLPGNDDAGAMSAWYVWGAIGLYPISPGDDTLLLGAPIFDQVDLALEPNFYDGRHFIIRTVHNAPDAPYVQSATLNGQPLTHPWIRHADVINGGTLELDLGTTPSTWGTAPEDAPPSLTPAK